MSKLKAQINKSLHVMKQLLKQLKKKTTFTGYAPPGALRRKVRFKKRPSKRASSTQILYIRTTKKRKKLPKKPKYAKGDIVHVRTRPGESYYGKIVRDGRIMNNNMKYRIRFIVLGSSQKAVLQTKAFWINEKQLRKKAKNVDLSILGKWQTNLKPKHKAKIEY